MTKVSTLIRQMAKEGHKLQSLERASVLAASDDPKDQDKAREIKTRFDYESLKRQIGSKKKPSKPAVNETKMPNVSSNDKKAIKSRAKNLFKRDLEGEHDSVNESVGGGVPMTPQELEIQKKMSRLNVRLAKKRNAQMMKAKTKDTETAPEQVKEASAVLDANAKIRKKDQRKKNEKELRRLLIHAIDVKKGRAESVEHIDEGDVHSGQGEKIQKRTKKWMDKKGMKGAPGLDAMKARTAEHKAKRGVKEEVIDERTLSSYIPSDRQGEARRANLDYTKAQLKKKEDESTKNRGDLSKRDAGKMAKERLRTKKIMSMGEAEDKAFNYVLDKLRKKHGKDGVITKTSKPKPPSEEQKKKAAAERKKRQEADNKAYAARAKKAGFKSTQDYTNVVARYGSEENYRKGKGLGT